MLRGRSSDLLYVDDALIDEKDDGRKAQYSDQCIINKELLNLIARRSSVELLCGMQSLKQEVVHLTRAPSLIS